MNREALHDLVDRLPEPEVVAAQRYLEYLNASPVYRAALSAPKDDEPVTEGDVLAIEKALDDVQAGRTVPHDEILHEFGLK